MNKLPLKSTSGCSRANVIRHGAAPRANRAYAMNGDGERGFNSIEKILGAETIRLQAPVVPKSPVHVG
jgi:hypothetical protein